MKGLYTLPKIMCILFIGIGLYFLITNIIKQLTWTSTTAVVLEVKERKDDSNQFYPLVEFQTETGKKVQVEIKQSSNRFYPEKGEEIAIIYSSDNFKQAAINSKGWVFGFPLIFISVGIIGFFIPSDWWHIS